MSNYSFKYKGKIYQFDENHFTGDMLNTTAEFHLKQMEFLIKQQDWVTLENRLNGYLIWGGLIEQGC